jgi:hypothetical protein
VIRFFLCTVLLLPCAASAVVIRADVDDTKYRIEATAFPALVDMPGEGHGVLIDRHWVITAAHVVAGYHGAPAVTINGTKRAVDRIEIHPGYKQPPQALIDQALHTGDATLVLAFLVNSDDIALVRLKAPVEDVAPVAVYPEDVRIDQTIRFVGKGATGTGAAGHEPTGPNRTELRHAFNQVSSADGRWFCYVFDAPPTALPLEGSMGNGDSGSPVLVQVNEDWLVAGLAAWKLGHGDVRAFRPGRYGQASCNVRLSHYRAWIDSFVSES